MNIFASAAVCQQVFDKLEINSFHEVFNLYMRSRNQDSSSNNKIVHTLVGELVLEKDSVTPFNLDLWSLDLGICLDLLFSVTSGDLSRIYLTNLKGALLFVLKDIDTNDLCYFCTNLMHPLHKFNHSNWHTKVKYIVAIDDI